MVQSGEHSSTARDVEGIAIVGMACLFPGADSPARFWHNIINKMDYVKDPPADWQPELFLDTTGRRDDRVYTGRGGYLGSLCRFDPTKHGVMPSGIDGSEPDQFIALRCASEALADAGVPQIAINREKTGVIMGRGTYLNRGYVTLVQHGFIVDQVVDVIRQIDPDRSEEDFAVLKAELKRNMPPLNADTVPGLCHSVLVGRIANRLDLNGPTYTVDGACASSLLAVEAGMRELRSGHCDAMLVGGVAVSTLALIDLLFCHLEALSRTGQIAPFSSEANGTLLGQGCGVIVLKRLSDALRDGNRVYAVLRAVGVASDGRGGGLLAPQQAGQELAIKRAYQEAGLSTASIELIEAHATGIPLGDETEIKSLTGCFGTRVAHGPAIALGSVKSMISHLIPAAGIASLIKTSLALYHRVLPPTLHAERPNPALDLDKTPFYLCTETRPWIHADPSVPRRAGVNAFGFGGINAHAIIEEPPVADGASLDSLNRRWPAELVVVSAANRAELRTRAESLAAWVDHAEDVDLLDIAATCARTSERCKLTICAKDPADLAKKLRHAAKLLGDPNRSKIQVRSGIFWYDRPLASQGTLAFVFPGEGAQYVNMLADLCLHFPEVRRQFDLTDEAFLRDGPDRRPSRLIFPVPAETEWAEARLFEMDVAVEAVMTANRALMALLSRLDIKPHAVVGHSSGEFAALLAAGAIDISDDEELIHTIKRGATCTRRIINSGLVPAAVLTAVGGAGTGEVERVVAQFEGRLRIALDNCPHQVVLVGDEEATEAAVDQLRRKGAICQRVPWDRAYHTEAFSPACGLLEDYCASLRLRSPDIPLWSCVTARPYPRDPAAIGQLMVRQWRSKVRFRETVRTMHEAGTSIFLEVGPRGNLASFINDTLAGQPHLAVAINVARKSGLEQLCFALAMLAAHGVPMNLGALYERRQPDGIDLSTEPPTRREQDPVLRLELPDLKIGEQAAQALQTVRGPSASPQRRAESAATHTGQGDNPRGRAFADFQHTMRQFLETQKDIMTRFARRRVGSGSSPRPSVPQTPDAPDAASVNDRSPDSTAVGPGSSARRPGRSTAAASSPSQEGESAPTVSAARPSVRADEHGYLKGEQTEEPPHASAAAAARPRARLPFVEEVVLHEPGTRVIVECGLDVATLPFLRDHAFGRTVSVTDRSLTGLIAMPLSMTIELMAEAAATLRPGHQVSAVRDVRLLEWLVFATPTKRIRTEAKEGGDGGIYTTVAEVTSDGQEVPVATGTVELSPVRSSLGKPTIAIQAAEPSRWRAGEVYTRGMFHGPAFQAVVSLDARNAQSVRATLREPDPALMFGDERGNELVLPVALIDGVGQVVGLWGGEDDLKMGFPSAIERLEVAPADTRKTPFAATGQIDTQGDRWCSDVEVCSEDGAVVLRLQGRIDQVFDLPPHIWRYRTSPRSLIFSRESRDLFEDVPAARHCTICELDNFGGPFLAEANGVWALLLSRYILNRKEREVFAKLRLPPRALASWLLGRVVAKDAVRVHLSLDVCMADVGIDPGEHGRPTATLPDGDVPVISLAHAGYDAVAVAGNARALTGVGIDLELMRPVETSVVDDAFSSRERRLIEAAARGRDDGLDAWYVSAWCAKEAVGKALGHGLLGGPRSVEILDIDPETGRLSTQIGGALAQAVGQQIGRPGGEIRAEAYRRVAGDRVIALCLIQKSDGAGTLQAPQERAARP